METTPLHTVNFSTIVSESRNIVKANKGHFFALSLFFLPFSISIVVTPTLHSHLPGNFFTGELFHKSLLSHPIPVVLHLLYILIVYLLIFCGIGTISYSTYNVLIGKPVSYFASLKSLTFSFLPLISTAILAHTIMFLILLTFLLFGGIIVMFGESVGFVIGFFSVILISFSIIIVKIIYLQTNWCLAFMVVVAESNWGIPALKRSWYLVKGMRSVSVSLSSHFLIFFGSYFLIFFGSLVMLFSYNVPETVDAWSILNMIWLTITGSLMPNRISHQSIMNIFKKKPTPKEALRESKREMSNATRGIEREITALQLEEKKLVAEIKRTAKTGNEAATKILARQLVRLRQQIANLQSSRAQMRGIATHTQALAAHSSVAVGMKGATKAMAAMNKEMAPAKQMKVMQDFQKQSAQMDMTTEMMSDAIDDVLDDDEAEDETDDLTNQVLDEIGVDVASQLSSAPKGKIAGKNTEDASSSGIDELEKRLAALRG